MFNVRRRIVEKTLFYMLRQKLTVSDARFFFLDVLSNKTYKYFCQWFAVLFFDSGRFGVNIPV